jgi:hypothetical protein
MTLPAVRSIPLAIALVVGLAMPARGMSPWTLARGDVSLTPVFLYETFDRFFMGTEEASGPERGMHQFTFLTTVEYGLLDGLTADLTLGYTRAVLRTAAGKVGEDGLADSSFGLRYRLVDEFQSNAAATPTVSLRIGGIAEGTYDAGLVQSPGDGASGVQVDLLGGKTFGSSGFGVAGDVGYRHRTEIVPDDLLLAAGLYQTFARHWQASAGVRHERGLSGTDIGAQGFNFPGLKEIATSIEAGLGYVHPAGHFLGLSFAHTVDGRNTGKKFVYGGVATFVF